MRILSFNIKFGRITDIKTIINILKIYNPDIVALQEVNKKQYIEIESHLNNHYRIIRANSNILLTTYYITDFKMLKLNITQSGVVSINGNISDTSYDTAIWAKLVINSLDINLIITHLNVISEEIRLRQIQILQPWLSITDILIGNLNSLYIDDYDPQTIEIINKNRIKYNIEPVRYDVINLLLQYGFIIPSFTGNTTKYGTRIDYILYKKNIDYMLNLYSQPKNYVLDTINTGISDNNIIVLEAIIDDLFLITSNTFTQEDFSHIEESVTIDSSQTLESDLNVRTAYLRQISTPKEDLLLTN